MRTQIVKMNEKHLDEVHQLIHQLAIYERAEAQHTASVDDLLRYGFGKEKIFEGLVAFHENKVVGLALFYFKYSTWKGKSLYLEDLVVDQAFRNLGIGQLLFDEVVAFAKANGCKRMDWQVLNWNEAAIKFYQKNKALLSDEWLNGQLFFDEYTNL